VTIVRSRYGGIYEPGEWLAFACNPDELPHEWNAGDAVCARFYDERKGEVGGGASPQEAYESLRRLMEQRRFRPHP
jgi:hypothetical protein